MRNAFLSILTVVSIVACEGDNEIDEPSSTEPVTTIIEYRSSNDVLADVIPFQDTATKIRYFGKKSAEGSPIAVTAISTTRKDTIQNYLLDEKQRIKYVFGSIKGIKINRFLKIDYLQDSTITLTTFNYKWDQSSATIDSSYTYKYQADGWIPTMGKLNENQNIIPFVEFVPKLQGSLLFCGGVAAASLLASGGLAAPWAAIFTAGCIAGVGWGFVKSETKISNDPPPNSFPNPEENREEIGARSYSSMGIIRYAFKKCDGGISHFLTDGTGWTILDAYTNQDGGGTYIVAFSCNATGYIGVRCLGEPGDIRPIPRCN